jgi:hypothetical protein
MDQGEETEGLTAAPAWIAKELASADVGTTSGSSGRASTKEM